MLSQTIALLLLASGSRADAGAEPEAKAASGYFGGECKRLGVIEVCRHGEVAEVRIRGHAGRSGAESPVRKSRKCA